VILVRLNIFEENVLEFVQDSIFQFCDELSVEVPCIMVAVNVPYKLL
jgi:hypothetical protein